MPVRYKLITSADSLDSLLQAVQTHATVALDSEADSQHHYREQLCLIQFTVGGRHWIVDALAGIQLAPLFALLRERKLIIHGADYDLRLLWRTYNFKPECVFDTMLAAQMLGWSQTGLAAVADQLCAVTLPKTHQRADWSHRPLAEHLLAYAVDDTRYLNRIARSLTKSLNEHGRLAWHEETCRRLVQSACASTADPNGEAWRIKGGRHLKGRAAAVLRELWHWRESLARQADRPPFKVANTEFILSWANWVDQHPRAGLDDTPARPAWLRGGRLHSFEQALARAFALPKSRWPGLPVPRSGNHVGNDDEKLLEKLIQSRDEVARRLGMDAGVVAPRDALKALIRLRHLAPEDLARQSPLMAWQIDCLGDALKQLFTHDQRDI